MLQIGAAEYVGKGAGSYREGGPVTEKSSNDNSPKIGQGLASQGRLSNATITAGIRSDLKFTDISTQPFSVPFSIAERPSSPPAGSVTIITGGEADRISGDR